MLIFQQWTGEYSDVYCCLLMLGLGFLKLQHSLVLYLASNFFGNLGQFFDSETEQFELNLFSAATFLGDCFTLYLA